MRRITMFVGAFGMAIPIFTDVTMSAELLYASATVTTILAMLTVPLSFRSMKRKRKKSEVDMFLMTSICVMATVAWIMAALTDVGVMA